jgi:alcohol dehydrogenase
MDAAKLAAVSRFVVPYGGLVRGRLAAGETIIVNGATGAYGGAAVLLSLAMGAGRVVAAGRNTMKLNALAKLGGRALATVALSGDVERDAASLRDAAGGGADIAFDMVGSSADPSSTLAALDVLRRGGRIVLMGGMAKDLPVPYLKLMINSLEIIGNFMHAPDAYRRVLGMVQAGHLDLAALTPKTYALADLDAAMVEAERADSLEYVVVTPKRYGPTRTEAI